MTNREESKAPIFDLVAFRADKAAEAAKPDERTGQFVKDVLRETYGSTPKMPTDLLLRVMCDLMPLTDEDKQRIAAQHEYDGPTIVPNSSETE
jgi:hypothetical protein